METSLLFFLSHPLPHGVGVGVGDGGGAAPTQPLNLGTPSRGAQGEPWDGGAHPRGCDSSTRVRGCPCVCLSRVRVRIAAPSCVTSCRCRDDPIEHMARALQHRGGSTLVALETAVIVAFFG